jgi:hypothetical protein
VWAEVRFYARDIRRGPKAKSIPGLLVYGLGMALVLFGLLEIGNWLL